MAVKLKVIHLIRRLERIQRDLEELSSLQSGLKEDREYTKRILDPLMDEATRLKNLKKRILSQVVLNPPEYLIQNGTKKIESAPTIVHPARDNKSEPKKEIPPASEDPGERKEAKSEKKGPKKTTSNPYKFIFEEPR